MLDELKIMVVAAIDEVKSRLGIKTSLDRIGDQLTVPVTARLDKTKSRRQLKSDLATLDKLYANVTTRLNTASAKKEIKAGLKKIGKQKIEIDGILKSDSIKKITKQVADATAKKSAGVNVDANVTGADSLNDVAEGMDRISRKSAAAVASVTLLHQAIYGLERAARNMVNTAADLDEKLTDLRMVTGGSYDDTAALVKSYNELARELGATTLEVSNAADEWLRQGKTAEETAQLIEQSMILSKVGAMESATATENLTSAMKGYGMAVEEVSGIVDKLTAIDLKAAVTASDLAVAMSRTANSANISGVSMDKLLGYLATVQEVTQKSAETIGESFKTIFARMGNIKLENFLDDDGEDLSDVESVLKHFGIVLRDGEKDFRSFGDVLDDVYAKWDQFSNVDKRALANAFAGVRQQENFLVLMENYGSALNYAEVAANSAGTALDKFGAYQDSIAAKAKEFTAAFESLSMNTINADFAKGIIDAGTALLTLIDQLDLLKITLATLGAAGVVKGFELLAGKATTLYGRITKISAAFELLKTAQNTQLNTEQFQNLLNITEGLNASQLRLIVTNSALTEEQRIALLTASGLTAAEAKQTLATLGLATAEGGATAATFSLSGAFTALTAAIAANPIGFLVVGLTAAVSTISSVVSHVKRAREELKQMISDLSTEIKGLQQSSANVKDLAKRFEELSAITSRSADEQEEWLSVQNQLKELLPTINGYYDEQGNFIIAQGESLDSLMQTYREYISLKRQELADAYAEKVNGDTKAFERQRKEIEKLNDLLKLRQMLENGEDIRGYTSQNMVDSGYQVYGDEAASYYYSDLAMLYSADMIELQKQMNDLQAENATILDELRDGTINVMSAQEEWFELAENEQNGLRNVISQMDYDSAKTLYEELTASGASYDDILQTLLKEHADMIPALESISDGAGDAADAINTAAEAADTFAEAISNVSSTMEAITQAQEELANSHTLTLDTVSSLAEKYPELEDALASFLAGLISEVQLQEELTAAYNKSLGDYEQIIIAKMEANNSFYENSVLSNAELVAKFAEDYGIDLKNFSNVAALKESVDAKLKTYLSTITADNVVDKAEQYGVDLENFTTIEEKKLAVAKAMAAACVKTYGIYQGYSAKGLRQEMQDLSRRNADGRYDDKIAEIQEFLANNQPFDYDAIIAQINSITANYVPAAPTTGKYSSSSGKSSSGSGSAPWADELKYYKYLRSMELMTDREYYEALNLLASKYYSSREKYVDDYRSLLTERFEMARAVAEDWFNDKEHQLFLMGENGTSGQDQIAVYKEMQAEAHRLAEEARAYGLDENSDYIQEHQKQWWDYQHSIQNIYAALYDAQIESHEKALSLLENQYNMMDNNSSRDAMGDNLERQLTEQKAIQEAAHKEAQRLRALGVDENDDAIQDCISTWWGAYDAIQDINSKIVDNVLSVYDDFIDYADDFDLWSNFDFTKVDYLKQKLKALNKLWEEGVLTLKEYNSLLKEIGVDIYNEQKEALIEIINKTEELIRQETEDRIDALESQIDAYRKIIELKKESLKASFDEDNYQKEVANRVKKIAEIRSKLAQLERDTSAGTNAEKAQLAEELADLQNELADYQSQYSYDAQVDSLDKQADAYEDSKNDEIKKLQQTIDTEEKLYNEAISRINDDWDALYADLIEWNRQYGDMIDGEDSITSAWKTAKDAAQEYGDVVSALNGINTEIYTQEKESANKQAQVDSILTQMSKNGSGWHSATTKAEKDRLVKTNEALAEQLSALIGRPVLKDQAGVWHLDSLTGPRLFHTGLKQGYVGADHPGKDEVLSVLKDGELVFTKDQYMRVFNSLKYGIYGISDTLLGNLTTQSPVVSEVVKSISNDNSSTDNSITEDGITLQNYFYLQDMTQENMERFAEMYSTYTINKLNSTSRRKGLKNSFGNSMLRG